MIELYVYSTKDLSKTLTFYRSYMAGYCDASKSKEGRNREYKLYLSRGIILHLLDVVTRLVHFKFPAVSKERAVS